MSNIIHMESKNDWFVMNMVKQYINTLKNSPQDADTIEAIQRNEIALRSFFDDIKSRSNEERSSQIAA